MKPLYLTEQVRSGFGGCLRPGGEQLTRRAIELIEPDLDWRILDGGCGPGGGINCLRKLGFTNVTGIDSEQELLKEVSGHDRKVVRGDLNFLPFRRSTFDLVLCECVWNLTDKKSVANGFRYVLKSGGYLVVSDIYLRNESAAEMSVWPLRSCFAQATGINAVVSQVSSCGFTIVSVEDHSQMLTQAAAEFVFAHGSLCRFWELVTGDRRAAETICAASRAFRPGLYLIVGKRTGHE